MVVLIPPPADLYTSDLALFYVVDELLAQSPILVLYGPSANAAGSSNSSRVQAHIFSPAGLQSYPRLTISPSSPLYAACNSLPREEQGDDVCRGLAFSIYKNFVELPEAARRAWEQRPTALAREPHDPKLFSDAHAAILASRMVKVENAEEVLQTLVMAFGAQCLSWIDLDIVLPPGTMRELDSSEASTSDLTESDAMRRRYGGYASVVKLFGQPSFLPTSRIRRAPSKPSGLNRNMSFSRGQKESLRREMCELLDTEENYVSKLKDLLNGVATEFRHKAEVRGTDSKSPDIKALERLFPTSLDHILKANTDFLEAMREVLEVTENDAIRDIEATMPDPTPQGSTETSSPDPTGAARVAECLLECLPTFAACYPDYIRAHAEFPQSMKVLMQEKDSSFTRRIQDTGEQRLMSMLIEPVQRLPRYNLYIDNIVKQLPPRHPAVKMFLNARDMISEICSQDDNAFSPSRMTACLQQLTEYWPMMLAIQGRLITVLDIQILKPPYVAGATTPATQPGILILFTDYLLFLRKSETANLSARVLMGQLDGSNVPIADHGIGRPFELHSCMRLSDVELSEFQDLGTVQFINSAKTRATSSTPASRSLEDGIVVCELLGSYSGRSSKLAEEIAKARIEARFSEPERESHRWEARSMVSTELSIFASLHEDSNQDHVKNRRMRSRIRVVVDERRGSTIVRAGQDGIDAIANLTIQGEGFFKLDITAQGEQPTKDHLTSKEFMAVFSKRIGNLLKQRFSMRNEAFAPILIARNQSILQAQHVALESGEKTALECAKERPRAPSPVKKLTNLFGGSTPNHQIKHTRGAASVSDISRLIPSPAFSRHGSTSSRSGKGHFGALSETTFAMDTHDSARLEQTLSSYLLALSARKGNIVGRTLSARHQTADEATTNELYNALLEDPLACHTAAQAPVDVLFAAFEKFIKVAWAHLHCAIMPEELLDGFFRTGNCNPHRFLEQCLPKMSTSNRRAFQDIITLLTCLLDGTSNDGDRGLLTAAFAEVLNPYGDNSPYELMTLLDFCVVDPDLLRDETGSCSELGLKPKADSTTLGNRSSKLIGGMTDLMGGLGHNSDMASNHSSIRKKFGFGTLNRKSTKAESSESPSVWRTLSKGRTNTNTNSTLFAQAPSLNRSLLQDERDHETISPKRPVSRDCPTIVSAFENHRPADVVDVQVAGRGPPRKKRRSSLSDLMELQNNMASNKLDFQLPQSPRQINPPRTGSPGKIAVPKRTASIRSSNKKENVNGQSTLPQPVQKLAPHGAVSNGLSRGSPNRPAIPRTQTSPDIAMDETASASPKKRSAATGIPLPRTTSHALHERPNIANIARFPAPEIKVPNAAPGSPTRKLRMQSPQKLKERLANEARAIQEADASLSAEMAKIGEELKYVSAGRRPGSSASRPNTASSTGSASFTHSLHDSAYGDTTIRALDARLKGLEATIPITIASLSKRVTTAEGDVSASLTVSESKARGLDELLRAAHAETEALHARYAEELAKFAVAAARNTSAEELALQMAGMREEQERLRKENARLRREVVGLRAQLK